MPVWQIVLIVILFLLAALVLILVAVHLIGRLCTAKSQGTQFCPGISRLWQAFFSNFKISHSGRDITETFRLLFVAMFLFGACLLVWSVAAAVLRVGYLVAAHPAPVPPFSPPPKFPSTWRVWGFLVLEVLRAAGSIAALCFASGLIGGLLGFLFGLPHPAPAGSPPSSQRSWHTSTNLTDISDWLTKIIIGVGLVTATQIWGGFLALTDSAAVWLFNARHGSPAVIPAAIIGTAIFGFMFTYLYTDLIVARLIADADIELGKLPDRTVTATIDAVLPFDEALVPRISRRMSGFDPGAQPTQEQLGAALKFRTVRLGDLTKRADVRNWARARALLNDYRPAADAYAQLIGMPDDGTVTDGPDLLIEAARVMNASGDRPQEAIAVAELALSKLDTALSLPVGAKEAIVGDAAALRLSRRVAGGYEAALKLLNDHLEGANALSDSSGRLHLLRAFAKGQKWHAPGSTQAERHRLRMEILSDLRFAFAHKQRPGDIRPFWDLSMPRSLGRDPNDREDDLAGIVDAADIHALTSPGPAQPH